MAHSSYLERIEELAAVRYWFDDSVERRRKAIGDWDTSAWTKPWTLAEASEIAGIKVPQPGDRFVTHSHARAPKCRAFTEMAPNGLYIKTLQPNFSFIAEEIHVVLIPRDRFRDLQEQYGIAIKCKHGWVNVTRGARRLARHLSR